VLGKSTTSKAVQFIPIRNGRRFLNPKINGSWLKTEALHFNYGDEIDFCVVDILQNPPEGTFSVTDELKWLENS